MSWKLLDRPKTLKVTKALATRFAEMDPAPHDRPLSERRLQVYRRLLDACQFRPVTWATAFCIETGGTYRVNGKHTSVMLSGMEDLPEFYVTIEEYECQTLEDVAKLYATFDSKMMSRSSNDIYLSFAATVSEFSDIPSKVLVLAAPALAYWKFGQDAYAKTQPADRAELLLEHSDFVCWLNSILSGGLEVGEVSKIRSTSLRRLAVVAAMMATWTKSKQASTEFWSAVRDETGAKPDLADRKLARYLVTTSTRKNESGSVKQVAGNREIMCKCLHSWNAWRRGETTKLNYYADKDIPTVR